MFYDGRLDAVETDAPGGLVTRDTYDGAGRLTLETQGSKTTVVQSTATKYDADGSPILVTTSQQLPSSGGYRVSYVTDYYDAGERLVGTADYGTNGGSAVSAPALNATPPARSANVQVTDYAYDANGNLSLTTAPDGVITEDSYDPLGRLIQTVQNYVAGNTAKTATQNVTTGYAYNADDEQTQVTVTNVVPVQHGDGSVTYTTAAQATLYTYAAAGAVNKGWLSQVRYPDGSIQSYTYDNLGDVVSETDRSGGRPSIRLRPGRARDQRSCDAHSHNDGFDGAEAVDHVQRVEPAGAAEQRRAGQRNLERDQPGGKRLQRLWADRRAVPEQLWRGHQRQLQGAVYLRPVQQ